MNIDDDRGIPEQLRHAEEGRCLIFPPGAETAVCLGQLYIDREKDCNSLSLSLKCTRHIYTPGVPARGCEATPPAPPPPPGC